MDDAVGKTTSTVVKADTEANCDPCSFDEQTVKAIGFCVVCIEYLCKECLKDHRKNKATRHHNVLKDDRIPTDVKSFQLLGQTVACELHPDKEVDYKCQDHDEFICVVCVGRNHRKCERVEEIADGLDETSERKNGKRIRKRFLKLKKGTVSLRQRKQSNIESLQNEKHNIAEKCSRHILQIQERLMNLREQSEQKTELIVQEEITSIKKEIATSVLMENEQLEQFDLLKTALEYGTLKQINVVVNSMAKKMQCFQEQVDELGKQRQVSVTFKPNVALLDTTAIGTVETIKLSPSEYAVYAQSNVELGSTFEGDVAIENEQGATKKLETQNKIEEIKSTSQPGTFVEQNKTENKAIIPPNSNNDGKCTRKEKKSMLIERKMAPAGTYTIKNSKDDKKCSIHGCVFLPNGRLVVIDKANSKIKVFDKSFNYLFGLKLKHAPFAICYVYGTIATTYSKVKIIDRYFIEEKLVESDGGFLTKLYGRGISKYHSSYVAILMVDKDDDSTANRAVIEIRDICDGKVIKVIETFKDVHGTEITIKQPCCLLSKDRTHIIGEQNRMRCFDKDGNLQWLYTNDEGDVMNGIRGLTFDKEGNIYMCGYLSGNVHQICPSDFKNGREIISNIKNPWCIAYDAGEERIVIGCVNDDHIHEFKCV